MGRRDKGTKRPHYPKKRKVRSDKGRKHNYPAKRKRRSKGNPLALGSLWGNERGLKAGKLYTKKDKNALKAGNIWGKEER